MIAVAAVVFAATPVGVATREFSISLYRERVRAGWVKFNVTNFGEDPHNLVVRRRGRVYGSSEEIGAGSRGVLKVRLRRRGTYTVICTVADHEALGMKSRLRVR